MFFNQHGMCNFSSKKNEQCTLTCKDDRRMLSIHAAFQGNCIQMIVIYDNVDHDVYVDPVWLVCPISWFLILRMMVAACNQMDRVTGHNAHRPLVDEVPTGRLPDYNNQMKAVWISVAVIYELGFVKNNHLNQPINQCSDLLCYWVVFSLHRNRL